MLRGIFICFLCITGSVFSQRTNLPMGQLLFHDEPTRSSEAHTSDNYMQKGFRFPDYLPVTVSSKNIYSVKYPQQIHIFDKQGKLVYSFEFSPRAELQNGKIITDHLIRWRSSRLGENKVTRVIVHYDQQGRLARRDSSITTHYILEPADTVVSYTSVSHWIFLSGAVVNKRNTFYNATYYKKKISAPANGLNAQQEQNAKARVYLKKELPTNYKEDSVYFDRFYQQDKNFGALVYSDSGKTEIYQQLSSSHYLKKHYHPLIKNTYGTKGADFEEPGVSTENEIDLTALGNLTPRGKTGSSPNHYKCTLTRRGLVDSIFVQSKSALSSDTVTSLIYTVRYRYYPMAEFSGNEYEPEPQIILSEQNTRYGERYFKANFNKYYPMSSNQPLWLADMNAFVKNRVKVIHVYYRGTDELQAFELDSAGNIIGGMEGAGRRQWKAYTDKNGHRFSSNYYYDGDKELEGKDSTVYIPKTIRHKDTTFSYDRMESYSYKKGALINERNRNYNEEYLNKRIRTTDMLGTYGALDCSGPKAKQEGCIYLKVPFKTNYDNNQLYLSIRSTGDYAFKVTKDTTDITDSITRFHRVKKQLKNPEIIKKLVSGEDFNPPYNHYGPICGGSGYNNHYESSNESANFHSFSWTLNSKGLYDTCYKTDPIIHRYSSEEDENGSTAPPSKKAPQKYVLYTMRYEYY